jgi:hypothetical protein
MTLRDIERDVALGALKGKVGTATLNYLPGSCRLDHALAATGQHTHGIHLQKNIGVQAGDVGQLENAQ